MKNTDFGQKERIRLHLVQTQGVCTKFCSNPSSSFFRYFTTEQKSLALEVKSEEHEQQEDSPSGDQMSKCHGNPSNSSNSTLP